MNFGNFQHRKAAASRQQGYILVILTLFVALLAYSVLATAPSVVQELKRDREEEMIHRGAQYARAIRKFVKKNGVYPTSLDQLDNTNHVRYLRRHYKDPFSQDGKWRLLHIGDVPFMSAGQAADASSQSSGQKGVAGQPLEASGSLGQPSGQLGSQLGQIGSQLGQLGSKLGQLGAQSPGGLGQPIGGAGDLLGSGSSQKTPGQTTTEKQETKAPTQDNKGNKDSTSAAPTGGLSSQPSTQKALSFGGGAILGVASASDKEAIKEFNGKSKYKEWYFVYSPAMEAANPKGGALIIGPYTGRTYGNAGGGIGTPASQIASPTQPSGFGQPIGTGFSGTSAPDSTLGGSRALQPGH